MIENILLIPEKRIAIAQAAILGSVRQLNTSNILGIAGFGSFWSKEIFRQPSDIDLVVYVNNEALFNNEDRFTITKPLQKQLDLETELHILTPYTVIVKHEANNYKIMLNERTMLFGQLPSWL